MFNKNLLALATGAALLVATQTSSAALVNAAQNLNYSITVNQACMVSTSGAVVFPTVDTMSADLNGVAAGSVNVTCPNLVPYTVLIGGGQYATANRNMFDGAGNFMSYHLLSNTLPVGDNNSPDASYIATALWAPGISGTGNGGVQQYPLTADVLVTTSPVAGTYNDSVAVTVAY